MKWKWISCVALVLAGTMTLVRVHPNGRNEVVLTGLTFPTGMTFGRDRRLYISNKGFEIPSKGTGEILAVDLDGRR
jgi:hypothetical protein